ncbi:MAG: sulfite exporter TauE/SafE family protein [Planctomycetes bacterium]|nr:sulfite exporter TauE/SafE family protein [Planctomycetota bacterium]
MLELTTARIVALVITGLVAGIGGGMLGIGGSVIFLPVLGSVFPDVSYNVFAAAALICNVFVGLGGAVGHYRNRRVIVKVVKMVIPLGILAAIAGVLAANTLGQYDLDKVLWVVFGTVVCFMVYNNVRKLFRKGQPAALDAADSLESLRMSLPRVSAVAVPTGFLAGMLGIGGGTYSVPSQQMILDMPQKNAIANSSATMVIFCAIAAVVKNITVPLPEGMSHWDPIKLAALLIPSAIVGAFIGGHLTHKLPDRLVRALFIGFLAWTAYKCFFVKVNLPQIVSGWIGG